MFVSLSKQFDFDGDKGSFTFDLRTVALDRAELSEPRPTAAFTMRKLQLLYLMTEVDETPTNHHVAQLLMDIYRSLNQLIEYCDDKVVHGRVEAAIRHLPSAITAVGDLTHDNGWGHMEVKLVDASLLKQIK
ncbi:hypothetical protein CYJ73_24970 [Gordonia terrae]|uniref:Uncharacterized protein n=1 Tax=Gordonia terrae TaxID=2055 RepID=A0A2I1R141_9ACTN|nr:hypothetical protein CYJ73_24970 [Gordonia terrae]